MQNLTPVPGATPRYDDDGNEIVEVATCGHCGRSWNDAAVSSVTPTPSGRCPFEYEHDTPAERLEYLRGEINNERISMSEVAELQGLAEHIDPSDVQLLEWAGVPEFPVEIETETTTEYVEIQKWDSPTGQWGEHWFTSTECGTPEALLNEARENVEREMKLDPSQRFRVRVVKEIIYSTEQ